MSYYFGVKASTKAEAIVKVREELEKVVTAQPVHAVDRDQAQATAEAFIGLLADDPAQDVSVSMNGSIWKTDAGVQQANVNVTVSPTKRG